MIERDLIAEARALCAKATPGPWRISKSGLIVDGNGTALFAGSGWRDNAELVAYSRTIVPWLCTALEDALEQAQPQWISVKDGLPEVGEAVLLRTTYRGTPDYNPVTIGMLFQPPDRRGKPYWEWVQYSKKSRYTGDYPYASFICPGGEHITHWMLLPEPPKEDADAQV